MSRLHRAESVSSNRPARAWMFTVNNFSEEQFLFVLEKKSGGLLSYYCIGLEEGDSGTMHLQGYAEYSQPVRGTAVQHDFCPTEPERVHYEVRFSTSDSCRAYICDDEKQGSFGWWEDGVISRGQGARKDLDVIREEITAGKPMMEIADAHFGSWVRSYRALDRFQFMLQQKKAQAWRDLETEVLFGATGSGKTRTAMSKCADPFVIDAPSSGALWFDGYTGQDHLILDDFTGWIPLAFLLKVLDGYPLRLSVKGSHTWAQWTKVTITSNIAPAEWYSPEATSKHPGALQRRLKLISMMRLPVPPALQSTTVVTDFYGTPENYRGQINRNS